MATINIKVEGNKFEQNSAVIREMNTYEVCEELQDLKRKASENGRPDIAESIDALMKNVEEEKPDNIRELLNKIKGEALDFLKDRATDALKKFLHW